MDDFCKEFNLYMLVDYLPEDDAYRYRFWNKQQNFALSMKISSREMSLFKIHGKEFNDYLKQRVVEAMHLSRDKFQQYLAKKG